MKRRLLGGTALLIAAFSLNEARAQTCAVPPTCESLGYDRTAGECSDAVKSLRCPLDKDKVFCLTAAEVEEIVGKPGQSNKVAEIGDLVYTDIISAEPIPGRIPVGIVYDVSGKMVSVAEYAGTDKCAEHTADGTTGWTLASMEDMGAIKANVEKINETIDKIGNNTPRLSINCSSYYGCCYSASNGRACMVANASLTSETSLGCNYCKTTSFEIKSRCVRKFGPNGANDVASTPTPSVTTYAVGDAYKDSEGNVIGTVVAVNARGTSGTIAFAPGIDTASNANLFCVQKTTGGKSWSLASGANACRLLKSAGSYSASWVGPSSGNRYPATTTCGLHSINGSGACEDSTWKPAEGNKTSCETTDSLAYVCEAQF